MAFQDVAVDGWALTVERRLLPMAALAQTLGMTLGNFITNAGVICLQTETCVSFAFDGPVPLSTLAAVVASLHFLVTFAVLLLTVEEGDLSEGEIVSKNFKGVEENPSSISDMRPTDQSCRELTFMVFSMLKRRQTRTLVALLLSSRVAFALTESNTLPAVEFVKAGGYMGRLAFVLAFQYPLQVCHFDLSGMLTFDRPTFTSTSTSSLGCLGMDVGSLAGIVYRKPLAIMEASPHRAPFTRTRNPAHNQAGVHVCINFVGGDHHFRASDGGE
jgi:hypothetical protein